MRVRLGIDGDAGGLRLGPTFAILDAVAGAPSLLAASRTLGISYRSAWSRLAAIEAALGQRVVIKTKGHGTALTPYGAALHATLARTFQRLAPDLAAEEVRLAESLRALRPPEPWRLRLAGSHDPLLLGAVAEISAIDLAVAGSLDAVALLRAGEADAAGFHYGARGEAPAPFAALFADRDLVVHPLFDRQQGFLLPPGNPRAVESVGDIARMNLRYVNRQRGAGTRIWFERLCAEAGLSPERIVGSRTEEFTHQAVAALIATGEADVGLGTPAVAERFGLAFRPVGWETYFLAIRAHLWERSIDPTGSPLTNLLDAIAAAAGTTLGYAPPDPAYQRAAWG
ncbi:substrate-binding domain-containing protein [Methylobacterium sp. J-068]|uniref:helix-turn-helix transcriptional regulator n=1 Tax=Methylobacterium sp. J-068 TaxID=2836649 RepID=UPI001FBB3388|nr:substrate-binding domain-containing protein [Methylobacterium sp. J-068]MCJ2037321.1 helix-turn-helix transcriptional regulator [Methylobacterium sp. J-068]